jgi:predicted HTH domain antitoxin
LEEIEKLARSRGIDRSDAIRRLIDEGLRVERIQEAVNLVRENKVTIWRAAEIAGVSYREMLRILKSRNVPFPLTPGELKTELGELLEGSE